MQFEREAASSFAKLDLNLRTPTAKECEWESMVINKSINRHRDRCTAGMHRCKNLAILDSYSVSQSNFASDLMMFMLNISLNDFNLVMRRPQRSLGRKGSLRHNRSNGQPKVPPLRVINKRLHLFGAVLFGNPFTSGNQQYKVAKFGLPPTGESQDR